MCGVWGRSCLFLGVFKGSKPKKHLSLLLLVLWLVCLLVCTVDGTLPSVSVYLLSRFHLSARPPDGLTGTEINAHREGEWRPMRRHASVCEIEQVIEEVKVTCSARCACVRVSEWRVPEGFVCTLLGGFADMRSCACLSVMSGSQWNFVHLQYCTQGQLWSTCTSAVSISF